MIPQDLSSPMSIPDDSIVNDWKKLQTSDRECRVPVALFVLCKTVVEDDAGALFFNGTAVRKVLLSKQTVRPDPRDAHAKVQEDLIFKIKVKGPAAGDHLSSRRIDSNELETGGVVIGSETLDITSAPMSVRQHWSWFPFRILLATIDFELQAKNHKFVGNKGNVMLCPTLFSNSEKDTVSRVQVTGALSRSNRLSFVNEAPAIKFIEDQRLSMTLADDKRKAYMDMMKAENGQRFDPEDLFITYPQLRLEFYLHEPFARAVFKIVGPLVLVVVLMLVNFHEFYGVFEVWDGCPSGGRDPDYLANAIGIAIAAAVVVPAIRADRIKSPHVSFTKDDCMAVVFLAGLALSTWPHCHAAVAGCLLSSFVVLSAVFGCAQYFVECHRLQHMKTNSPAQVRADPNGVKKSVTSFERIDWKPASTLPEAPPTRSGGS